LFNTGEGGILAGQTKHLWSTSLVP